MICEKCGGKTSDLYQHVLTVHSRRCPYCSVKYLNLTIHLWADHRAELENGHWQKERGQK